MDNWVNLTIDPQVAASIVALRPAIETLVIRAANDPENVGAPNQQEDKTIQVRKKKSSYIYIYHHWCFDQTLKTHKIYPLFFVFFYLQKKKNVKRCQNFLN